MDNKSKNQEKDSDVNVSVGGNFNAGQMAVGTGITQISIESEKAQGTTPQSKKIDADHVTLHQKLDRYFSENQLQTLVFNLDIDYENLPGDTKSGKSRALILEINRQERMGDLLHFCKEMRPNVDWS